MLMQRQLDVSETFVCYQGLVLYFNKDLFYLYDLILLITHTYLYSDLENKRIREKCGLSLIFFTIISIPVLHFKGHLFQITFQDSTDFTGSVTHPTETWLLEAKASSDGPFFLFLWLYKIFFVPLNGCHSSPRTLPKKPPAQATLTIFPPVRPWLPHHSTSVTFHPW